MSHPPHLPDESVSAGVVHLLSTKRFLPLFITQFITSFNDNFFKNALVALLTYGILAQSLDEASQHWYVMLGGALFILPFFLFSATAGILADRFEKTQIVKVVKICEIIMMVVGAYGFWTNNIHFLLLIIFLMGVHSTFFSPIKYGILPTYLKPIELVAGNALIEAATFAAIVLGTMFGTQLILKPEIGPHLTAGIMITLSVLGYISCLSMPKAYPHASLLSQTFSWNPLIHNKIILGTLRKNKEILRYVLASTWFWFVAAVMMTLFPLYVKDILRLDKNVYTFLLVLFSIGVGTGSFLCSLLLKGKISARYTPVAALVMGVLAFDVGMNAVPLYTGEGIGTLGDFFQNTLWVRITFDMAVIALAGGLYAVPFFALLQDRAGEGQKAQIFAANNIVNAAGMVGAVVYIAVMKGLGLDIGQILMTIGALCLVGAFAVHCITPDSILRGKSL